MKNAFSSVRIPKTMIKELIFLSTDYAIRHHITCHTNVKFTVFVLFNIILVDEFWISVWALLFLVMIEMC